MAEPVVVDPGPASRPEEPRATGDATPSNEEPADQQPRTPEPESTAAADGPRLENLNVASIIPNTFQPRKRFTDDSLDELARSIRSAGVLQPVVVRPAGPKAGSSAGAADGVEWELVAGERRWRAAQRAGLERIPAVVTEASDRESAELALVENLQREDLNPVERAEALKRLRDDFGLTQSQVAEQIGLDRATVANLIRLTDLEPEILELLASGRLSAGHGKALLALEAGPERLRLAQRAAEENWSVRRVEAATSGPSSDSAGGAEPAAPQSEGSPSSAHLQALERKLGDHLGAKLKIKPSRKGPSGTITIKYFDLDHFDSLLEKLNYR